MWTERDVRDKGSVQIVLDFIAAVRDQRIKDVLALVDPEIICVPLTSGSAGGRFQRVS
jgi:hypothetical protein